MFRRRMTLAELTEPLTSVLDYWRGLGGEELAALFQKRHHALLDIAHIADADAREQARGPARQRLEDPQRRLERRQRHAEELERPPPP